MRKFCVYWLPVIAWASVIFIFSTALFSGSRTQIIFGDGLTLHRIVRKAAHVTEYFILCVLLFRALRQGSEVAWKSSWAWICLVVIVAYAASDEFHQSFVPSREARVMDVGFDSFGGLMALGAIWIRHRRRLASAPQA